MLRIKIKKNIMEVVHSKGFIPFKKCIKNYKVIGWGSCSDVIVSNEIGYNCVIKRVVKSLLNSKEIDYFFNEVSCLKRISCSSIVSMKYVFQTELTYNLVLEKVPKIPTFYFVKNTKKTQEI